MKADILPLICDPNTHDALELRTEGDSHSRPQEFLVNPRTGQRFPLRDGIPIFLRQGEVSGSNRRYQKMYDRFAPFYDLSTWLYSRWKGMRVETRLREYLDELEVTSETGFWKCQLAQDATCNSCRAAQATLDWISRGAC